MVLLNNPLVLLYGGTFNPIHFGHIKPVISLKKSISIKELLYIPCHIPPHKKAPKLSAKQRLNMTVDAIAETNFPFPVKVSDFELGSIEPSYSLKTILHFKTVYPDNDLGFLMGLDSLLSFTQWYKWQEILENCYLVVMTRPGFNLNDSNLAPEITEQIGRRVFTISCEDVPVSSTMIREVINGKAPIETIEAFLPESTKRYVIECSE